MSSIAKVLRLRPRFTIAGMLFIATAAAMFLGFGRQFVAKRPVTERQTQAVRAGMTSIEVRWRLGAPHRVFLDPKLDRWGYDYADSEHLPLDFFNVVIENGVVIKAERQAHLPSL